MESHHVLVAVFTLAFGAVVTLCVYLRSFIRFVYLASKVPGPSLWDFLIIGEKILRRETSMEAFISLAESSNRKPYGLWLKNGHFLVVVTDGESVRQVFRNTCMQNKPGQLYDALTLYAGEGLLSINGAEHRRHRRLLSPCFQKAALDGHLPEINEEVSILIKRIREEPGSKVVNFQSLIQDKIQTVVSLFLYGKPFRLYGDLMETYFKYLRVISRIVRIQMLSPFWPIIKWRKAIRTPVAYSWEAIDTLKRVVLEQEAPLFKKQVERDSRYSSDIRESLATRMAKEGFTDKEAFAEVRHILAASAETSDFAECVCLYLLALHPEVQERVYDEVYSILGGSDPAVEPEDLSKMLYLDMVIKEVFRLFPPAPTIARSVDEETYFQGILLPKGCMVAVDILSLQRNPSHFKDPLKFVPERFSADRSHELHPFAYIPFSYGKRGCPGQAYAIMSLKTSLSRIIRDFKVFPVGGSKCIADIKYKIQITFVMKDMPLRFVARNNKACSSVGTVK